MKVDYEKILRASKKDAVDVYIYSLRAAQKYAEIFASDPMENILPYQRFNIIQEGYKDGAIYDDLNWRFAIQTFFAYGEGYVKKGSGRKSCCYDMYFTNYLRDNYEFENSLNPISHFAGGVVDGEMWLLNAIGHAKHFKIRGSIRRHFVWIKGTRFKEVDMPAILNRSLKPVPQCQ